MLLDDYTMRKDTFTSFLFQMPDGNEGEENDQNQRGPSAFTKSINQDLEQENQTNFEITDYDEERKLREKGTGVPFPSLPGSLAE